MEKIKIAATGCSGIIGSKLPKEVLPLRTRLESPFIEKIQELQPLSPNVLVHLAGMVVVKSCDENPELCFHLNVDGAAAWFEAAEKSGVKRFIFASTSHVYAKSESPIGTDHPLAPSTTYGESKLRAELRLQKLAKNSTLQLVIARIFSVLDENSKPGFLLPKLIQRAKQKDYSPIPGLFCFRDFLTSSEVAASLWRLAMAPSPPRVVNICSGRATQIAELARNIFSQYGADPSRLKAADDTSNPYMVGVPTVF